MVVVGRVGIGPAGHDGNVVAGRILAGVPRFVNVKLDRHCAHSKDWSDKQGWFDELEIDFDVQPFIPTPPPPFSSFDPTQVAK